MWSQNGRHSIPLQTARIEAAMTPRSRPVCANWRPGREVRGLRRESKSLGGRRPAAVGSVGRAAMGRTIIGFRPSGAVQVRWAGRRKLATRPSRPASCPRDGTVHSPGWGASSHSRRPASRGQGPTHWIGLKRMLRSFDRLGRNWRAPTQFITPASFAPSSEFYPAWTRMQAPVSRTR